MTALPDTAPFELSALTQPQWHALRVYQDLYQLLLTLLNDTPKPEREASEEDPELLGAQGISEALLQEEASRTLQGPTRQLLELTFDELIQQLLDAQWVRRLPSGDLALSRSFERRVLKVIDGQEPFTEPKVTKRPVERAKPAPQDELEYVDLFTHISQDNETLLTARHLERIVSALDGVTLMMNSVYELVSFSKDPEFPELINAMEGAELLTREGKYIKLTLAGANIARESRAERLTLLGVIAERLRRDRDRAQR